MSRACLVDLTKCIGCRGCQVACKQWNELPAETTRFFSGTGGYQNPPALSSKTYTLVHYDEIEEGSKLGWIFSKQQCLHCLEPSCVSACPVFALKRTDEGAVIYDPQICMGCRYCMMACPFGIPTLEWEKPIPFIKKCTFCSDRLTSSLSETKVNDEVMSQESNGRFQTSHQKPACSKTCPTEAVKFGERCDLLEEAWERINSGGSNYVKHIYGENEAGGTAWLYISNVEFSKISGFPMNVGATPYPQFTKTAMESVPWIVAGGGVVLGGLYWLYNRRQEVTEGEE